MLIKYILLIPSSFILSIPFDHSYHYSYQYSTNFSEIWWFFAKYCCNRRCLWYCCCAYLCHFEIEVFDVANVQIVKMYVAVLRAFVE